MRNHTVRLYLAVATLLAFFVLWTTIAAKPWSSPAKATVDPRLKALAVRQWHLQREAAHLKRLVAKRWAVYERRLRVREQQIAAVKQAYAQQLAAAREAAARIAAAQAAASSRSSASTSRQVLTKVVVTRTSSAVPAAPAPAPAPAAAAPQVVTLPPQVQVVTLPPASSSGSSK